MRPTRAFLVLGGETVTDLITQLWSALRDAGLPEVMLYLPDGSACRCHWDNTSLIGETRVALLADQDRKIVRIMPLQDCKGIGIASPKGTDPMGYRPVVQEKLAECFGGDAPEVGGDEDKTLVHSEAKAS